MGELLSERDKRDALERVLTSRTFEKTGRARDLLAYIVNEEISGNADAIKGFSIAVDVFGKDERFDAVSDPLVRVQAGRLRDYLKHYFADEGVDDPVVIEVPRGGYRPVFTRRKGAGEGTVRGQDENRPVSRQPTGAVTDVEPGSSFGAGISSGPSGSTEPGMPGGRVKSSPVARQIRLLWFALLLVALILAAMMIGYFSGFFEDQRVTQTSPDLPRIRVLVDASSPEVMGSAERISSIMAGFDTVAIEPLLPTGLNDSEDANWHILDYGLKVSELLPVGSDQPPRFKAEVIHLASGDLLRSEIYSTAFWSTPERELVTASKMSGLLLPGSVIYADITARDAQTPYIACFRLIRDYYDNRTGETHKAALECSKQLQSVNAIGGIMRSMYGAILADGLGREYPDTEMPVDREGAMREALDIALSGVDLAPASARAAREVGFIHSWLGHGGKMLEWIERANKLNPYDTSIAASMGFALVLHGRYKDAVPVLSIATKATTRHPTWWDFYLSLALLMEDRIAEAKMAAEHLSNVEKNLYYAILNAALAFEQGDRHRAAVAVRHIREQHPEFAANPELPFTKRGMPKEMAERLIRDLQESGL